MQVDAIERYVCIANAEADYIRNHIFYIYRKAVKHVISKHRHELDRRRIHELNWLCIMALQSMLNYPQLKQYWENKIEQLYNEIKQV